MVEGIYFQFPKLGFLLFFFLACEALCPLRTNTLYFSQAALFGEVGVKPARWMWISKWAMIILFIAALMSPVRDKVITYQGGGKYDILLILDPAVIDDRIKTELSEWIDKRPDEAIGLWIPAHAEVSIPLTHDHGTLKSILFQTNKEKNYGAVNTHISRFFTASDAKEKWVIIFTHDPKTFIVSLPAGIEASVAPEEDTKNWIDALHRDHPEFIRSQEHRYTDYYYIYPLFLGFMAMLAYLYGRNQRGLK